MSAVQIGDSEPAPLLTKIVGPSEEARVAGEARKEFKERHAIRHRFWTELLDEAKGRTRLHANISPRSYSWAGVAAGLRGLAWNYVLRQNDTSVELYIDRGDEESNADVLKQLEAHRQQVETEFGSALEWQRLEGKRACRIRCRLEKGGWKDESRWPEIRVATIDAMIRLEKALGPHVKKLQVDKG